MMRTTETDTYVSKGRYKYDLNLLFSTGFESMASALALQYSTNTLSTQQIGSVGETLQH